MACDEPAVVFGRAVGTDHRHGAGNVAVFGHAG
jgi:hypothetical protein